MRMIGQSWKFECSFLENLKKKRGERSNYDKQLNGCDKVASIALTQ